MALHRRAALLIAGAVLLLAPPATGADEKEIPSMLCGTWGLRLTSNDAGKTYLSGDNQPICEVGATEIKFVRKFEHADEKMTVKSVSKTDVEGTPHYVIRFTNGKA